MTIIENKDGILSDTISAILVTNNAYDAVILADGTACMVSDSVFKDFLNEQDGFSSWQSPDDWRQEGSKNIVEAADTYGEWVVWYDKEGKLHIEDDFKWEERKLFYSCNA